MRTWRFHEKCPEGKIFDTEPGMPDPLVPRESDGWVDTPAKLILDPKAAADRMVENAVRAELAKQGPDRERLDREHRQKFGVDPHNQATNAEVANVIDNKLADGSASFTPAKRYKSFTRNTER